MTFSADNSDSRWEMPSITQKVDGSARQVGVEIELIGIPVEELAETVRAAVDGDTVRSSRSVFDVKVPEQGSYRIEVDYELLKEMAKDEAAAGDEDVPLAQSLAIDAVDAVASVIVPCEIVSPPLPMTKMPEPMDAIVNAVRHAGAEGTNASLFYAFGVHLNVEPPDLAEDTILRYLQAFVCLFDWIVWQGDVDLSRRVTPYINAFPRDYEKKILNPDYQPDINTLLHDYLQYNPTRNRAMDMLPLFAHIDKESVMAAVDDPRIKARPTFHYRLANSCVDEPEWSIADPWSRWLRVEQLANDEAGIRQLSDAWLADKDRLLNSIDNDWRERVAEWLERY